MSGRLSSPGARALVVAVAATLVVAGCGRSRSPASPSPTSAGTLPSPTAAPATPPRTSPATARSAPITMWVASAPQPSPDLAAAHLVGAWAAGKQATAASVASPQAVATLFATAYPGQALTISRGCSSEFLPIVCTFGPSGGASPSDAVFEVDVSQMSGGWYVSSVKILR